MHMHTRACFSMLLTRMALSVSEVLWPWSGRRRLPGSQAPPRRLPRPQWAQIEFHGKTKNLVTTSFLLLLVRHLLLVAWHLLLLALKLYQESSDGGTW